MKRLELHAEADASTSPKNRNAVLDMGGAASCSLWWDHSPPLEGHRLGVIGEYQASTLEASQTLLEASCAVLKDHGCTLAVGPMDGNTWRKYRFVIEPGNMPSFFMEPENPPEWPQFFRESGFKEFAHYSSSICSDLSASAPRVTDARQRLRSQGVVIRPICPESFSDELSRIYSVAAISFQQNYLYTPLPEKDFISQYLPFRDTIVHELVFMAEKNDGLVGFLFAIPDFAEASKSGRATRAIGKTLAVLPGRQYAGLGRVMVEDLHQAALQLGFTQVIHALQHDGNAKSRNLSRHYGRIFRRYALFSRPL